MVERSGWVEITDTDPEHSARYVERFRAMDEAGKDLAGEARLVDAMAPRRARILDAGCGPGRVGGFLHALGHTVVGVDVDPVLIAAAELDHPGPAWLVGDLAEVDAADIGSPVPSFDLIVSAGNVMTFLHPGTRREVLRRLGGQLTADGRLVVGFGAGRDYEFDDFFADVEAAGLGVESRLETWDVRPFTDDSDFLVAILVRTDRPTGRPTD